MRLTVVERHAPQQATPDEPVGNSGSQPGDTTSDGAIENKAPGRTADKRSVSTVSRRAISQVQQGAAAATVGREESLPRACVGIYRPALREPLFAASFLLNNTTLVANAAITVAARATYCCLDMGSCSQSPCKRKGDHGISGAIASMTAALLLGLTKSAGFNQ